MPQPSSFFCEDDATARDLFLGLCTRSGIDLQSLAAGGGDVQDCAIARLGAPDADTAVVLATGAAGQAGLVNAAICAGAVAERLYSDLPRNTALLLFHAPVSTATPWPPVDVAFTDKGTGADATPARWSSPLLNAADSRYRATDKTGDVPVPSIAAHAVAPTVWSQRDVSETAKRHLRGYKRVRFIDFRTGQGAWAEATVTTRRGTDGRRLFHAETKPDEPAAAGLPVYAGPAEIGLTLVTYGTFPGTVPFAAITQGDAMPSRYPKAPDWRRHVWTHARSLIQASIAAVGDVPSPAAAGTA